MQTLREGEGNIHSGATPPWLKEDEEDAAGSNEVVPVMIGPSEVDFLRHSECLTTDISGMFLAPCVCLGVVCCYACTCLTEDQNSGRKGKNPKRVGADFHLRLTSQPASSPGDKEW